MQHATESYLWRVACQSNDPISDIGGSRTVRTDLTAIETSPIGLLDIFLLPPLSLRVKPNSLLHIVKREIHIQGLDHLYYSG